MRLLFPVLLALLLLPPPALVRPLPAAGAGPARALAQEVVRVSNTGGEGVVLRAAPSATSERLAALAEGALLEVVGADRVVDSAAWRNVRDAVGHAGWVRADYLAPAGAALSPTVPAPAAAPTPALTPEQRLALLTTPEKVGQLFLLSFEGVQAADAAAAIRELHAGGVVLLHNATTADAARQLTGDLQRLARESGQLPLLIAVDHEGGPVQRIRDGMTVFGPNWELGQIAPEAAIPAACRRGRVHGRELVGVGIQMNLAPVLDLWDNPENTVIAERSFSADPEVAARLGAAYIEALQGEGVLAVGKHFPGHGSSADDSHLTLPVVWHDRVRLDAHELVPFRAAVRAGVAAIMAAHVSYPLVDSVADRPASLSPDIVGGLLRGDLGYQGLVVTDDLGMMQAITARYAPGEAAVQALQAGADLLILTGPLERQQAAVAAVATAVGGAISEQRLDESVLRVLRAKQQAGLLGERPSLAPAHPLCPAGD